MSTSDDDKNFYDALRNSQPLAFLASFAIALAVLLHTVPKFTPLSDYAVIAGCMFLFSFIASLIYQLGIVLGSAKKFTQRSQYFFLAFGIGYLLFIILNLSVNMPSIIGSVFGWIFFVMGASGVPLFIKEWKNVKKNRPRIAYSIFLMLFLFGMSAIFFSSTFLSPLHPITK